MFGDLIFCFLLIFSIYHIFTPGILLKIHDNLSSITNVHILYAGLVIIISFKTLHLFSEFAPQGFTNSDQQNPLESMYNFLNSMTTYIYYIGLALIPVSFITKLTQTILERKNQNKQ
ncbi:hypothetical protein O185_15190 [Photorhabdus temperata J3]|uniref:Uncharacterized protein n=1 Tax=Photorhabdus temperata J3 TaxID=1389415 RepID=U7QW49_PHOTE|nr:hypothetical protein O185_15190 [Photorhabdus temperata J3]